MASRYCQKPLNFLETSLKSKDYRVIEIVGSGTSGDGRVSWKKLQFLLLIAEFAIWCRVLATNYIPYEGYEGQNSRKIFSISELLS